MTPKDRATAQEIAQGRGTKTKVSRPLFFEREIKLKTYLKLVTELCMIYV